MFGLDAITKFIARKKRVGLVLFGHGASALTEDHFVSNRATHINVVELEKTIIHCKKLGFDLVSMEQVLELADRNFQADRPWVHLTFDDGYVNNVTQLQPLMQKHQAPWTLFVSTHHAQTGTYFYHYTLRCGVYHATQPIHLEVGGKVFDLPAEATPDERKAFYNSLKYKHLGKDDLLDLLSQVEDCMSADQWQQCHAKYEDENPITVDMLKQLANDPLVHIGSHCHHHLILNEQMSQQQMHDEIFISRQWLIDTLGIDPVTFCYPNGQPSDFSAQAMQLCEEAGYRLAFTTIPGVVNAHCKAFAVNRRSISPTIAKTRSRLARTILRTLKSHG